MLDFKKQFLEGNNLTKFLIKQNGETVNELSLDNDKDTLDFTIETSLQKYVTGENNRIFQIDSYSVNSNFSHDPLKGNKVKLNYDVRGTVNVTSNFSIDKNLVNGKYIGLDIFYLVESLKNGEYKYEPIFKTLLPVELN